MNSQTELKKQKYDTVYAALERSYGRPTWRQHLPPVDELVSTILSQSTSDSNRDKGFYALKDRYPDWVAVMDADEAEVIETIRSAGLANQKGPRIQAALRTVYEEQGELTLDFLDDLELEDAIAWLTKMKGVGRKTASIVMLFAFGRPAFPVDTHVHRITKRLGFIGPKVNATKAHELMEAIAPEDTYYPMHLNIIRHGREVCKARNPQCMVCPLQEMCDFYQEGTK